MTDWAIHVFNRRKIVKTIRKIHNNMRVRNYCSKSVLRLLCLSVLVIVTACSNNNSKSAKTISNKSTVNASEKSKELAAKDNQHTHPANPCTDAVAHSHVYTVIEHKHTYDCESTNEFTHNAHIHPATSKTRKFRHVHPNGASKHVHHKE